MNPEVALAWTLTYLAHSTVLIASAWLCVRAGAVRRLAAREWLWRAALLGGIATASVQTIGGVEPIVGSAALPGKVTERLERVATSRQAPSLAQDPGPARMPTSERAPLRTEFTLRERGVSFPLDRNSTAEACLAWAQSAGPALGIFLLGVWLIGLSIRARLALGRRRPVDSGFWRDELTALAGTAGVRRPIRLTCSARLAAPVALGVLRPEVCVPARVLGERCAHLARPALAHELAHIARFDPLWLGITHIVRSLFFAQPLNRLAARELAHLAELSADDWAARRTGDGIALARCLTEVAEWLRPVDPPLGTCAMVRRRGKLAERVHRLLDKSARQERVRKLPAPVALVLLGAATFALPGWAAHRPDASRPIPERSWRAAESQLMDLGGELRSIEARLIAIPHTAIHETVHADERDRLESRLRDLRAQVDRTRRALERCAPQSEHVSRPGGQR